MENLLTYILQINLLLTVVFLGYTILLKGLTFYRLNRVYLLVGVVYALIYPFLDVKGWFKEEMVMHLPITLDYVDIYVREGKASGIRLIDVILWTFAIGGLILLLKLVIQFFSLLRIHMHSTMSTWGAYIFQNVLFPIVPFSFFNKIYIHERQHVAAELNDIFKHEYIHVKGLHTIDILLFEILLIGCWYNPFVWLMRKAVRQNLEFLTDQQVLDKGVDRQAYQYSLLNVTKQGVAVAVGSQFNFKTLKKRIMMMNKRRSSKIELSKYVFILPVMILAGATFTVNSAEASIERVIEKVQETEIISAPIVTSLKNGVNGMLNEGGKVDTNKQENKPYPLLHPSFNREDLAKKNMHYQIDGKLVSLDEFLAFPRTEIYAVDIYKDRQEIFKKIGKEHSEGLIVMTSKKGIQPESSVSPLQGQVSGIRIGDLRTNSDSTNKPLMVLDGEIISNEKLEAISPDDIESISVFKDQNATALYGDKGKNGVLLITTKMGKKPGIKGNNAPEEGVSYKNTSTVTKGKSVLSITEGGNLKNPLVVIDEMVQKTGFDLNSIEAKDIESVTVLKGEQAISVYGAQGKEGVVIVETKSMASKRDKTGSSRTWTLTPNSTKEDEVAMYGNINAGAKELNVENDIGKNDVRVEHQAEADLRKFQQYLSEVHSKFYSGKEYLLIVDGEAVPESYLSKIDARKVNSVSAISLKNSALISAKFPENLIGILRIETLKDEKELSGIVKAQAGFKENGKEYHIVVDSQKNAHPFITKKSR